MMEPLLPLFPLELVLLPRAPLPLHVFEPRYKEMIGEVLRESGEFGIVQAKGRGILRVGCAAIVQQVLKEYEDGRMDILASGTRRFEILDVDTQRDFLRAKVRFFEDDDFAPVSPATRTRALAAHRQLPDAGEVDEDDPEMSFLLGAISQDLDYRQTLLTLRSEADRMEQTATHLELLVVRNRIGEGLRKVAGQNGHARRHPGLPDLKN